MTFTLEVCVDSAAGLALCADQAVDRIELCSALGLGGLTPSPGLMALAGQMPVPAHAMIRPRAGDFAFGAGDMAQMQADIAAARAAGLAGVVLGAARGGRLDHDLLARLIATAEGMEASLHRVIDTLPDPVAAVDQAIALGFARILTSGGAVTAPQGQAVIAAMIATAHGRIAIQAGSGVTPAAVPGLAAIGVRDFHASCAADRPNQASGLAPGFGHPHRRETDAEQIRHLRAALTAQGRSTTPPNSSST